MTRPPLRWRRIAAAALLTIVGLVAVWWRSETILDDTGALALVAVEDDYSDAFHTNLEPFRFSGAWRIVSRNTNMHSFSGLASSREGTLLAVTDRGYQVLFDPPGAGTAQTIAPVLLQLPHGPHHMPDAEAVDIDPETGLRWLAFEHQNAILRYDPASGQRVSVRPAEMADWPSNKGPETLARLTDGRFIVIAETLRGEPLAQPALLFAGDPVGGAAVKPFRLALPDPYRATGAALLPDGRVLLLGRALRFPFGFSAMLAVFDPASIRAGQIVRPVRVATIANAPVADNYEGLATTTDAAGNIVVWLISDNNQARKLQESWLLRLELSADSLARLGRREVSPPSAGPS